MSYFLFISLCPVEKVERYPYVFSPDVVTFEVMWDAVDVKDECPTRFVVLVGAPLSLQCFGGWVPIRQVLKERRHKSRVIE